MQKGATFVELVIAVLVLGILASVAMPVSKIAIKRTKELELKRNLRIIRTAIDEYKEEFNKNKFPEDRQIDSTGYPISLSLLVERKVLRRIPRDPMIPLDDEDDPEKFWNIKSSTDEKDSNMTDGRDVYDISSKSEGEAIDGTKYEEW